MVKHRYSLSCTVAITVAVSWISSVGTPVQCSAQDSFRANVALPDHQGSSGEETAPEILTALTDRGNTHQAGSIDAILTVDPPSRTGLLDTDDTIMAQIGPVPMPVPPTDPAPAAARPDNNAISGSENERTDLVGPQENSVIALEAKENTAEIGSPWEQQRLGRSLENAESKNKTEQKPSPSALPSIARTLVSLLIVLALIVGITYFFKRFCLNKHHNAMPTGVEILARSSMNPKQSLCLVQLGNRLVLLGQSPNHISALQTIDDPDEITHIMGQLETKKTLSITNTFDKLFHREKELYETDENPVISLDIEDPQDQDGSTQPWYQARGELSSLLDKVKGLSRIRSRS